MSFLRASLHRPGRAVGGLWGRGQLVACVTCWTENADEAKNSCKGSEARAIGGRGFAVLLGYVSEKVRAVL